MKKLNIIKSFHAMLQLPETHLMLVDEFNNCLGVQEAALRGWWGYQYLSILICTFQYSNFLPIGKKLIKSEKGLTTCSRHLCTQ
jgi:hypothetical protein